MSSNEGAVGRNVKKAGAIGKGLAKRTSARQDATAALRKHAVMSKRRAPNLDASLEPASSPQVSPEEVPALVAACRAEGGKAVSVALVALRRALSGEEEAAAEVAVASGVVDVLNAALAGSCAQNQVEAAQVLANLASWSYACTEAALPAAPLLIQRMEGGSARMQAHCILAIGNMAGDTTFDTSLRDRMRANGALLPVVRALRSTSPDVARTAAWALANLIRGPDPRLQEVFATDGAGATLISLLLRPAPPDEITVEALWALSLMTHGQPGFQREVVESGGAARCVDLLQEGGGEARVPALRVIGNLAAGDDALSDALLSLPALLPTLGAFLAEEQHRALRKESAWTLGNLCAGTPAHREAVVSSGIPAALLHVLQTAHFDIRREAAYAFFHLVHDPAVAPRLLTREVASEFVGLLRAPDPQLVEAAVQVVAQVLAQMPGGARLIEELDGIDALERLTFSDGVAPSVAQYAAGLVDRYYGEDAPPYD